MSAPPLLSRLATPRKVALVRPSRLGDFICSLPAIRALRRAMPAAEITMITLPALADLVVRSPDVDRFEPFPGFPGLAEQLFEPRRTLAFLSRMQEERFDLAVQMHESGTHSNPFTLMLGAAVTAGFAREDGWASRLDAALPIPREGHEIDRLLALAAFLGARGGERSPALPLRPGDHEAAESLLAALPRPLLGVHAGGSEPSRRWPIGCHASVAARLQRRTGGTVVLLGAAGERELARLLHESTPSAVDLTGRTSVSVLAAVIVRLGVLLSGSSGPAHLAYALGTPTVTVAAAADQARYGPPPGPHRCLSPDDAEAADTALRYASELLAEPAGTCGTAGVSPVFGRI